MENRRPADKPDDLHTMRDMFQHREPPRRSPISALLSVVFHGAAAAGAVWLASVQVAQPPLPRERLAPFLRVSVPSAPVEVMETLRRAPLEMPKPAPVDRDAIVELPKHPELVTMAPTPPKLTPPETARQTPPIERRAVRIGEFAAATAPASQAEGRHVRTAGFEAQRAVAPDIGARVTSVGAFGSNRDNARLGTDRHTTAVAASGFETSQPHSVSVPAGRTVASGGFGGTSSNPAPTVVREAVKPSGFSDTPPAAAAAARQGAAPAVTAVEVLYKPTPAYSAEARALKIQGAVTLEVQFSAAGEVRVLRVVRGLGYGLDEMAISAAEQIRFKPARSDGRPVDFTANVEIVFRLT